MITLVTDEVKQRQRTGFNYWSIPGREDPVNYKTETLDECIERIFKVNVHAHTRKREVIFAKHLKRYILERLTNENTVSDKPRKQMYAGLKYVLSDLEVICGCDHCTLIHSSKTAQNLIDTNREYREMAEKVLQKIELNLIIFP